MERREHSSNDEAKQFALDAIGTVAMRKHWMAVAWCVEDGRVDLTRCTTFQFPKTGFADALGQLALRLATESQRTSGPPVPDPLPGVALPGLAEKIFERPVEEEEGVFEEDHDEEDDGLSEEAGEGDFE